MAQLVQVKHHSIITSSTVRGIRMAVTILQQLVEHHKLEGYTVVGACPGKVMMMCSEHSTQPQPADQDFCVVMQYMPVKRTQ